VGETDGWLYIAMEYFEGRTLAQHLEEARGSSPPDPSARWRLGSPRDPEYALRACRIVQQMAEALDHAHRHGVIHRDVKPQNVVLDEEGAPHLVDFGLARTLADPRISETGEQIGTPYYMSPEQARAETTRIDHRSDVFSLGVVLYEVLTLRRPFDGGSREEILAAITTVQPRQIRAVNPLVPVDVETICLQCMEKEPRHRYASAADLATDLGRALHVQPIVARRPTRWDHGLRRLRRRWRESAVVAAVGVGALLAWWGTRGAPVPEPLVAITVHAPDDARAFAQEMRFLEEPGSSRYLGAGPEVTASLPRGIYRVTVRNSLGFAEITLQARKEPVEVTAVIRPTPEVVRDMVPIPGGDFVFGHPEGPPPYDRRREYVADFYIDRTEVSNRQYQRFAQATGHPEPPSFASKAAWTEREWDLPVVTVTYLDAKEYAAWAGKRLPTYKEWSRAARGTGGLELPWPPDDRPPEQHARVGPQVEVVPAYSSFGNQQYLQLASPVEDALDDVSPEGVKQMLGNVMEITDTVLVDLIGGELVENPTLRWTRGFSYAPTDVQHMLSGGTQFPVDQRHHLIGFRCAKSAGFDEP
jgi:serine/threonine-protein kinase